MKRQLYGVYTPAKNASPNQIIDELFESIEAGLPWLQIRDKSKENNLWHLWQQVAIKSDEHNIQLIINDNVDLLLFIQQHLKSENKNGLLPGLHLGQDDLALQNARSRVSADTIIGITCHDSVALAETAIDGGADYVAFGRFFPSITKPDAPPASIAVINSFQKQNSQNKPIAVIGGIDSSNIEKLLHTPASLYAVSNAIWGQKSITSAIKTFTQALK